jgi:hypothetical protein
MCILRLMKSYNYRYAIGGNDYGSYNHGAGLYYNHRIKKDGGSWESRANYPRGIHRHCVAVDHGHDRIYSLGGHDGSYTRGENYYYSVSGNSWHHHSNLPWTSMYDVACEIVVQKDGARWLMMVTGGWNGYVSYYDLTSNSGFHHVSTLYGNYNQRTMSMVSLSPGNTLLMGGYSQRNSHSTRNIWRYNFDQKNFYDTLHYIRNEHGYGAPFTKARKTLKALTNCQAERTYAVVGWGGHTTSGSDYPPQWSVLLRKRRVVGDPQKPARCDTAIPDLSPGRYAPGNRANVELLPAYRCDGGELPTDGVWGTSIRTVH